MGACQEAKLIRGINWFQSFAAEYQVYDFADLLAVGLVDHALRIF